MTGLTCCEDAVMASPIYSLVGYSSLPAPKRFSDVPSLVMVKNLLIMLSGISAIILCASYMLFRFNFTDNDWHVSQSYIGFKLKSSSKNFKLRDVGEPNSHGSSGILIESTDTPFSEETFNVESRLQVRKGAQKVFCRRHKLISAGRNTV